MTQVSDPGPSWPSCITSFGWSLNTGYTVIHFNLTSDHFFVTETTGRNGKVYLVP